MWLLTTNSMRARPTPSAGMRHHRKAAAGLARLSITCVRVCGKVVDPDLFGLVIGVALIDEALVALSTRYRHFLLIVQHLVASPVPTIAGSPSSRLTIAA